MKVILWQQKKLREAAMKAEKLKWSVKWSRLAVKYGATKAAQLLARRGAPPKFEQVYIAMIGQIGEDKFLEAVKESKCVVDAWHARLNSSLDAHIKAGLEDMILAEGTPEEIALARVQVPDLSPEIKNFFDLAVIASKSPWAVYWIRIHCSEMPSDSKRKCDQILAEASDSKWKWFAKDIPDFENVT